MAKMKELFKKLARLLFGPYAIYHIHSCSPQCGPEAAPDSARFHFVELEKSLIESSSDRLIREQLAYHGSEVHSYGCLDGSEIVAVCYFWHGTAYAKRNFWPLAEREAKLVQIVTKPQMRGRGIASGLILFGSEEMFRQGFTRLYARIWHSNASSLKSFEKAGWIRVATVIEVFPLQAKRAWRITFYRGRIGAIGLRQPPAPSV
jgi:RimJ/RimL family protein N-acetyltransferase